MRNPLFGQYYLGVVGVGAVEEQGVAQDFVRQAHKFKAFNF